MTYKLFIDDERFPVVPYEWVIVRSSKAAIDHVEKHGIPLFISFDHDLGGDDTSRRFINYLIDYMIDNDKSFPDGFDFYVHSQNPIGADWIRSTMNGLIKEFSNPSNNEFMEF